jgi:fimbrial chaperone protein
MRIGLHLNIGAAGRIVPAALALLIGLALPAVARAGAFTVMPVKLELGTEGTTAVLRVTNQDMDPVVLQVSTKAWSQDDQGGPVYQDTPDVVVFPKLLTIQPKEQRLLRVGYRGPRTGEVELTYRLFIEEVPVGAEAKAGLSMNLRIGVPLFIAPHKTRRDVVLGDLALADGNLDVPVENRGNVHVVVGRMTAAGVEPDGTKRVLAEQRGWYVLAGRRRTFHLALPEDACKASRTIELGADADGTELSGRLDVDAARCAPTP